MDKNGNKFDILKLILAILIVCIHSTKAGMILRPVFRLAVPLFFMISSYLFFLKQSTLTSRHERCEGFRKYAKRILKLYLFWFVLLLPFTIYYREWYIDFGFEKLTSIVKSFFFGSTFIASWFLMASLIGVAIVWLLSLWKVKNIWIIVIGIVTYLFCCFVSNYNSLMTNFPRFIEVYNGYTSKFTLPFNSFPCSILFVGIGKLLAENQFAPYNKKLFVFLLFSFLGLYIEFFFTKHYCKVYFDDCYFMLPAVCICIFMLIGQSRPCEIGLNTKKLRSYSTIIYCCHGTLLSWQHIILQDMGIKEPDDIAVLLMFLIAIAVPIALAELFLFLERHRHLRWLRYSH